MIPVYNCSFSGVLKPGESPHPFRKPIPLIRQIIRDLDLHGDTIIDPFCGSGSTGVAGLLEACRVKLNDRDISSVDLANFRTENFELWRSSEPKEGIKMTEQKKTKTKVKRRRTGSARENRLLNKTYTASKKTSIR